MERSSPSLLLYFRSFGALAAAVLLTIAAARAVWHLHDLSGMRHIAGDWMALAQSLNRGVFYPPIEEDGYYAGTRYMPLLFGLIAGTERLLGDYLLATKLVTLLAVIALVAATFAVVRRVTGRWLEALALSGLVLAFPEGLMALLSPHADALAVALSVWGLFVLASETPRPAQVVLAAVLMALAFGTKFSALAAPAAAVVFLLPRKPQAGITLAVVFGGLVLAGLALIHFASQGRFEENFRALASGRMTFDFMKMAPARLGLGLWTSSVFFAFVAPFILPLALLTVLENWRTRGLTVWDWYFLASIGTTLFVFASPGTDLNHLLELEIASVLVVGQRFRPLGRDERAAGLIPAGASPAARPSSFFPNALSRILLLIPLLIGAYVAVKNPEWHPQENPEAFWFWQQHEPTFGQLAEQLPPNPHLLTEDATPVVLLGQRPVVMDAFAFRILAENGAIDDQKLVERINRREFNALVLLRRLDSPNERLESFHFTPKVMEALRKAYRFDRQEGQYFIHQPAPDDKTPAGRG